MEDEITLSIPRYEVEGQLDFISSVCESVKFDPKKLIPLIFADWIATFQKGCQLAPPPEVFINYLKSTKDTYKLLKEIKNIVEKEMENDRKEK